MKRKYVVGFLVMFILQARAWGQSETQKSPTDSSTVYLVPLKPFQLYTYDYRSYQGGISAARQSLHPFISKYKAAPKQPRNIVSDIIGATISNAICKDCIEPVYIANFQYHYQHGNQVPIYSSN